MMDPRFIAAIFGPLFIIIAIWGFSQKKQLSEVAESFKKTPSLQYFSAVINLILGITIANVSPFWQWHFVLLVTLLGWFFIVRGVIILFLHDTARKMYRMQSEAAPVWHLIILLWGIGLSFFAYN